MQKLTGSVSVRGRFSEEMTAVTSHGTRDPWTNLGWDPSLPFSSLLPSSNFSIILSTFPSCSFAKLKSFQVFYKSRELPYMSVSAFLMRWKCLRFRRTESIELRCFVVEKLVADDVSKGTRLMSILVIMLNYATGCLLHNYLSHSYSI